LQENTIDVTHDVKNGKRTVKRKTYNGRTKETIKPCQCKRLDAFFEGSKMYIKEFICALMMAGWEIKMAAVNSARHLKDHNV
jgi:hypothetical protein